MEPQGVGASSSPCATPFNERSSQRHAPRYYPRDTGQMQWNAPQRHTTPDGFLTQKGRLSQFAPLQAQLPIFDVQGKSQGESIPQHEHPVASRQICKFLGTSLRP